MEEMRKLKENQKKQPALVEPPIPVSSNNLPPVGRPMMGLPSIG